MTTYETEVPGTAVEPVTATPVPPRPVRRWPLAFIGAPAAVAVWSGWVGLGQMCGFGIIHPLPGIVDSFQLNTAITLPIGVEAYGAYALGVWLRPGGVSATAREFAKRSAIGALTLGMAGQVIYHLLAAAHATRAPWPVVMLVSCLPVIAIGMGAALTHLLHDAAVPVRDGGEPPAEHGDGSAQDVATELRAEIEAALTALQADLHAGIKTAQAALRAEIEAARADAESGDADPAPVDRDALVAELANQMRDAVTSGDRWIPDYDALMARTGYRRRWCEKAVQDARTLVLSGPYGVRADENPDASGPRTGPAADADAGPHEDADRADELVLAGTS